MSLIDKKWLDDMEAPLTGPLRPELTSVLTIVRDRALELIHLARLGLWAREHGIQALMASAPYFGGGGDPCAVKMAESAQKRALRRLPKGVFNDECPACTRGEFPHRNCVLR